MRDLGKSLEPGSALAVLLVEHVWARGMKDAVARVGGRALTSEFVDAAKLSELAPERSQDGAMTYLIAAVT